MTREDLQLFHAGCYGGRSLVCAVVGDVEGVDVDALFGEALFGWGAEAMALPVFPEIAAGVPSRIDTEIPDRPNLDLFLGHA